jgi:hypothetical protein
MTNVLTPAEKAKYSVRSWIRSLIPGSSEQAPFEEGIAQKLSQPGSGVKAMRPVPLDVICPGLGRRDLSAGVFGSGGALVPTEIDENVIPLLRNQPVVKKLGCTILAGLEGNFALPRQTSPSTAQNVSETGQVQSSNPSFDQVIMTPHRISCSVSFSRQLLMQSSPDVEELIRSDISAQINLALDRCALWGQGAADEPLGLLNCPGVGSTLFGGTATWANIVAFESSLGTANVLNSDGSFGWAITPATKGRWKVINRVGINGSSTVPIFLINDDDEDNRGLFRVNGYKAAATNQLPNNAAVFGKWSDLVLGIFGSPDFIYDPFTGATAATIRLTLNLFVDVAVRHPQSFCISADSSIQ